MAKPTFRSHEKQFMEKLKIWVAYFRANPHRFVEEYLEIKLHLFQRILVFMCFKVDYFMYLASRGQYFPN